MKLKVSGIITTFNEERYIEDCIKSMNWCDEILIVDSYSTDNTINLAKQFEKVRILQREYFGSGSQKNWAIDQAKNKWVFILDADERCTPELYDEIESALENPQFEAYSIRRKSYFLGEEIKYSGWQNDWVVRLLTKTGGRCPYLRAHGAVMAYSKTHKFKNPMLHYMVDDIRYFFDRMTKYAYWTASQNYGKKVSVFKVFTHFFYHFFKSYFLRLGFLDLKIGFIFCVGQSYGTFLKYTLLWGWNKKGPRFIEPKLPNFDNEATNWYK